MHILFWLLIAVVVLYKLATHPRVVLFFLEIQISRLRPRITQYLHRQLTYWKETLEKFEQQDKVVRIIYHTPERILDHIGNVERDLNIDICYQRLKCKFSKKVGSLVMLAHNYLIFLQCLEFFRSTEGVDATNPTYAETAMEIGGKKSAVYRVFDELLGEKAQGSVV